MDPQVSHHIDKLKKRLHNSRIQVTGTIDKVLEKLISLETQASEITDEEFSLAISKAFDEIQATEPLKKVCQEHRESYAHIGRLGKELENYFKYNLEDLGANKAEPLNDEKLDSVIAGYLISQGMVEQADMINEKDNLQRAKLSSIYETIGFLESGDIDSALKKAIEIGNAPRNMMFCIHKLKFIEILKTGKLAEALEYARGNIQQFSDTHFEEIKHLMGSCLFVNSAENSPYNEFFKESYVKETLKEIMKEWSKSTNLPTVSCLETIVEAGEQVIPEIVPLAQVAGDKFWKNPMPTELKLSPDLKFHSTFVCPVSKEVATAGNPPMMLPCGHLIAKNSMDQLLATTIRAKFKCPTCPVEVTEREVKKLII